MPALRYKEREKQNYLSEFLSMKCSGDVLNIVSPLGDKAEKEISESMSMLKQVRKIVIKEPMKYNIIDICAGNALTSVLSVHLLPVVSAIAVDKRPRTRDWHKAKRFSYLTMDIFSDSIYDHIDENTIIIGVHACKNLAKRMIEIFNNSNAKYIFLMPCCIGDMSEFKIKIPDFIRSDIGKYNIWCWNLGSICNSGNVTLKKDIKNLSPRNVILKAVKG